MSACPVPRCSVCTTKFTPVPATAARTRSASWPMITKISGAGTTFFAVAITCARIGLPPISCRTLGCLDLSRVPLPAAIIAMAIRGRCGLDGEDFDLVLETLAMLSQYIVNESSLETRLAASPSTPDRLPIRSLRHQRHQVVRRPVRSMPRHRAFLQILSQHRAHAQCLDRFQIHYNLRSSLQRVLRLHLGRRRLAIDQGVVE